MGAYELAIYNGIETLEITDQNVWSSVECGTTIFMNIALVRSNYKDWRECPVCRTTNYPRNNSRKFALDWYVTMLLVDDAVHSSADSWSCDRRLQSEDNINRSIAGTRVVEKRDLELIRNIRIYNRVGSLIYCNKWQYSG